MFVSFKRDLSKHFLSMDKKPPIMSNLNLTSLLVIVTTTKGTGSRDTAIILPICITLNVKKTNWNNNLQRVD